MVSPACKTEVYNIRTTLLHLVAQEGSLNDLQKVLHTKKWNLNATDVNGMTSLQWCVFRHKWDYVKALVDAGAQPDYPLVERALIETISRSGRYAKLGDIARADALDESVQTCLSLGLCPPAFLDSMISTALMHQRAGIIRFLLNHDMLSPNYVLASGFSILHYIFWFQDKSLALELIARPDIYLDCAIVPSPLPYQPLALSIASHIRGIYPLHNAVLSQSAELLAAVIDKVNNLEPLNQERSTPLDMATAMREWALAYLLCEAGAGGEGELSWLKQILDTTEDAEERAQIENLIALLESPSEEEDVSIEVVVGMFPMTVEEDYGS